MKIFIYIILFINALSYCNAQQSNKKTITPTQSSVSSMSQDASLATGWFKLSVDMIASTVGCSPPVSSRILAYLSITLYETTLPTMPGNRSLVGQINGFGKLPLPENGKQYHWQAVSNAALAQMHRQFFPYDNIPYHQLDSVDTVEKYFEKQFAANGINAEVIRRSSAYGLLIAKAIYEYSKTDSIGYKGIYVNFPQDYTTPKNSKDWSPTDSLLVPILPYWGNARPFISDAIDVGIVKPPLNFSTTLTSDFYQQAFQVYNTRNKLTTEQERIARFWADGAGTYSPPGHLLGLVTQLIIDKKEPLNRAAEIYLRTTLALSDAFISCWKTKYTYNVLRPVTYIQKYIDPKWKPLVRTPPFPEYTSGHSTLAGVASYILTSFWGENTPFADRTYRGRADLNFPIREYQNFMEMGKEISISRLYAGIHYPMSNEEAFNAGIRIAKAHDKIKLK